MPSRLALLRLSRALYALLAWLGCTSRAAAEEPPAAPAERVRLVYALGADCPTPEALERELDARLGPGWQARPDELARTLTVTEGAASESHVVRIDYTDGLRRPVAREVNARSCEEAAAMTAVVVAVAIDALARERESAKAPPALHEAALVTPTTPGRAAVTMPPALAPQSHPPHLVHEAGLRVGVTSGFGTRAAWGAGAEWGLVAASGFAVRAALEARTTGSVPAADARARFSAFTARADACMVALRLSARLSAPLCVGLEAGALRAEGVVLAPAVTSTQPSVVPWFAALVTPRLRLATARAYVELVPELRVPLAGHTFVFESPERRVFTIPALAVGVSLAAGMRFY